MKIEVPNECFFELLFFVLLFLVGLPDAAVGAQCQSRPVDHASQPDGSPHLFIRGEQPLCQVAPALRGVNQSTGNDAIWCLFLLFVACVPAETDDEHSCGREL